MLGQTLNVVIPAVLLSYGIYLLFRMLRNRGKSCSCGGCSGCPMAGGCQNIRQRNGKEEPKP